MKRPAGLCLAEAAADSVTSAKRPCHSKLRHNRKVRFEVAGEGACPYTFGPMAKALTKSQIVASLAETVGLTKKQGAEALEALVALAHKNAKNSFTIPGLGKLVLVNRKARMGRNPATGEAIKIAAKRVVKFRIAKAAKDAILSAK
jgi:DNA-binding protein HU-beta